MKISTKELTTDRKWSAATGLNKEKFYKLLEIFKCEYKKIYGKSVEERNKENLSNKNNSEIKDEEDLLLLTLFSLKSGLSYDLLGLTLGLDGSNVKRHQEVGLKVLEEALKNNGYMPKRSFSNVSEFQEYMRGQDSLIIDVTEQRINRPKRNQKKSYSGKKNAIH